MPLPPPPYPKDAPPPSHVLTTIATSFSPPPLFSFFPENDKTIIAFPLPSLPPPLSSSWERRERGEVRGIKMWFSFLLSPSPFRQHFPISSSFVLLLLLLLLLRLLLLPSPLLSSPLLLFSGIFSLSPLQGSVVVFLPSPPAAVSGCPHVTPCG